MEISGGFSVCFSFTFRPSVSLQFLLVSLSVSPSLFVCVCIFVSPSVFVCVFYLFYITPPELCVSSSIYPQLVSLLPGIIYIQDLFDILSNCRHLHCYLSVLFSYLLYTLYCAHDRLF
jgi:hypothetical protein